MSATAQRDWARHFRGLYQPRERRWATPGALARALDPVTRDSLPLTVIDRELVRLADHQVPADGLMVFMAPQEGKASG